MPYIVWVTWSLKGYLLSYRQKYFLWSKCCQSKSTAWNLMIFGMDSLCVVFYKFCKFQVNWIKYDVLDFLRLTFIRLKWLQKFYLPMDLQIRNIYAVSRAKLHTGKIWCRSVHKSWRYRPKCDFVRMVHMKRKRKRKRIILTSVAFSSSCR